MPLILGLRLAFFLLDSGTETFETSISLLSIGGLPRKYLISFISDSLSANSCWRFLLFSFSFCDRILFFFEALDVYDDLDSCEQGDLGWTSNADTDHDTDGCQDDSDEELDDDNDFDADADDQDE